MTVMAFPNWLRCVQAPTYCLGPLHTSQQGPTRCFEIYIVALSDIPQQAPILSQTCVNSQQTRQRVKIFCRPTKNWLLCGGLNYSFSKRLNNYTIMCNTETCPGQQKFESCLSEGQAGINTFHTLIMPNQKVFPFGSILPRLILFLNSQFLEASSLVSLQVLRKYM